MHLICGWHRCVRDGAREAVARGYLFAVASPLHRNSEGGRGQAALAIFEGHLGEAPRPGGVRRDVIATSMHTMEPFARLC